jgi:hypothetical protein
VNIRRIAKRAVPIVQFIGTVLVATVLAGGVVGSARDGRWGISVAVLLYGCLWLALWRWVAAPRQLHIDRDTAAVLVAVARSQPPERQLVDKDTDTIFRITPPFGRLRWFCPWMVSRSKGEAWREMYSDFLMGERFSSIASRTYLFGGRTLMGVDWVHPYRQTDNGPERVPQPHAGWRQAWRDASFYHRSGALFVPPEEAAELIEQLQRAVPVGGSGQPEA